MNTLQKVSQAAVRRTVAVTGFVALATAGSLANRVAEALSANFTPIDETASLPMGAGHTVELTDGRAWLASAGQPLTVAPDGIYRLSNEHLLKVAAGQAYADVQNPELIPRWKLCGPVCRLTDEGTASLSVQETYDSLNV